MIGRVLAWVLIAVAGLVLLREAYMFLEAGTYTPVAVAQLWSDISRSSFTFVQTTLEQHVPILWDPVLFTVLQWPASLVFGIPGLVLLLSTRSPAKKKKRKWRSGAFE